MEKSDFLNSVEVERQLAEKAWDVAEGDEAKARQLLNPGKLFVKARFADPDEGFYGLVFVDWDFSGTSLNQLEVVVSSDDSIEDLDPSLRYPEFKSRVEQFEVSSSKMGGYTDQLGNSLREFLSRSGSEVHAAIESESFNQLESILESFVEDELELIQLSLTADIETKLKVEGVTREKTDKSEASGEAVLPCRVEINPVKGVPVSRVSPGDSIYVELGDLESDQEKLADQLERFRAKNGMIPAEVIEKSATPAGNLRMDVQFQNDVKGKVSCGKDVSILVPDPPSSSSDGSGGLSEVMENELYLGLLLGFIILLVLGIWFFLL